MVLLANVGVIAISEGNWGDGGDDILVKMRSLAAQRGQAGSRRSDRSPSGASGVHRWSRVIAEGREHWPASRAAAEGVGRGISKIFTASTR